MTELNEYSRDPKLLIKLIEDVTHQLLTAEKKDEKLAMEEQLKEISRAIENLEKKQIFIPQVLRAEKTRLAAAVDTLEEPTRALRELADGLNRLLLELAPYARSENDGKRRRSSQTKRTRVPRTDDLTLRFLIIEALNHFGGTAPKRDIHKYMGDKLKDKLLPGDLIWRESTRNFAWENNTDWERFNMVKEGILKSGSPAGIWELSEGYK